MYTITKIADRAAFDAAILAGQFDLTLTEQPWGGDPMRIEARISHDGDAFHVAMRCWESDALATVVEDEGAVHLDSCMEFFFSPCPTLRPDYFNLEANPNGAIKFNYGEGRHGRIKTHGLPAVAAMNATRTENWWQLVYTIPFAFIREFAPEFLGASGDVIRANMYRCGEMAPHKQFVTLYPVGTPKPDYHRPEYFREMAIG